MLWWREPMKGKFEMKTTFAEWYETQGSGILPMSGEDMSEHSKRVAQAAWEKAVEIAALKMTENAEEKNELLRQALHTLASSRVFVISREKIRHPEGTEWYDQKTAAIRAHLKRG